MISLPSLKTCLSTPFLKQLPSRLSTMHFYDLTFGLWDQFYPERTITLCSRDPYYVTPCIKSQTNEFREGRCRRLPD